jgi:hypothetical protein
MKEDSDVYVRKPTAASIFFKYINIICGILLMGLGVYRYDKIPPTIK